ncbi:GNAT family N-acetyltransferase [Georgenia sp. TF02-10]|nr:GNAT family N-acetyltransferase [Georgenia sp. TF02-10]
MLAREGAAWTVLLVRSADPPQEGRWALPGGTVDPDEPTLDAACRELAEETGVVLGPEDLVLLGCYTDPGRDPRGRYASLLHLAVLPEPAQVRAASNGAEARWWPLRAGDGGVANDALAVDHAVLLRDVRRVAPHTSTPRVRRVVERDVPEVIRLHHAALWAAGAHAGPGGWDDDLEDVEAAYVQAGGEFLVATLGPVVVGMGALRPVDVVTAEVKRMRVLPRWQGRGVGRAVARALEDRAVDLGFRRLVLDTTEQQRAAVALYASLGFVRTGSTVVAGMPAVLFEKDLAPGP